MSNRPTKIHSAPACLLPVMLVMCGILLLGSGCGKDEPSPSYDRLRVQLVTDLFAALRANDPRAALNAADRLRALVPDDTFLEFVRTSETARLGLNETNRLIAAGRPHQAVAYLEEHTEMRRIVPEKADTLKRTAQALQSLAEYQNAKPFETASTGLAALRSLREKHEILTTSELFAQWHGQERNAMIDLRNAEIETSIQQLFIGSTDRFLKNAARITETTSKFADEYPNAALSRAWSALNQDALPTLERFLSTPTTARQARRQLAIATSLRWPDLSAVQTRPLWSFFEHVAAETAVEWRTRSLLAAKHGAPGEALAACRQMLEAGAKPDPVLITTLMQLTALPQAQFKARPWRTALPQMSDILDITTQLREEKRRD